MLGTNLAIYRELSRDSSTVVFSTYNSRRFIREFGDGRIRTFPIAEEAMTGMAVGAAMSGLRPLVELHRSSFLFVAMDPIVNQAAKLRFMSGGQVSIDLTIRVATRWQDHLGSQHEQAPYAAFLNIPGLSVFAPGTAEDAPRALTTALRARGPSIFFEAPSTWRDLPEETNLEPLPLGVARTVRQGSDATIIGIGGAVSIAVDAASQLSAEGISCTVIDPITLVPLDTATLCASALATRRVVVVDEAPAFGSISAEIAARLESTPELRSRLLHPVIRIGARDLPIPFAEVLENAVVPSVSDVVDAVRTTCAP